MKALRKKTSGITWKGSSLYYTHYTQCSWRAWNLQKLSHATDGKQGFVTLSLLIFHKVGLHKKKGCLNKLFKVNYFSSTDTEPFLVSKSGMITDSILLTDS